MYIKEYKHIKLSIIKTNLTPRLKLNLDNTKAFYFLLDVTIILNYFTIYNVYVFIYKKYVLYKKYNYYS